MQIFDAPGSSSPADVASHPERFSAAALRGFFRIASLWSLTNDEQRALLALPPSTVYKYRADPSNARLSRDTLERISYVFGIYKALAILLPRVESADTWVRRPNAAFGGKTALDRMTAGNVSDLYDVRRYLDGERGAS
ncbi:MAG: MbcA/ParS/Xre antitoxin family protein [Candidatus Velthaea sp.]